MHAPVSDHIAEGCRGVGEVLSTVGDKWTMQVVLALRDAPRRFNEIKRHVPGLSQQMLTRVLRSLERDGMVLRTVHPSAPPQVEYALTELGFSLLERVHPLATWASDHRELIRDNRLRYEASRR